MAILRLSLVISLILACSKSEEVRVEREVGQLDKKQDTTTVAPTSVESRFFDLGGIINQLFPGFNQGNQGEPGRNPPGMDFPANSQFYPPNAIQGQNPPITMRPSNGWPVIDDAKQFPNQAHLNTPTYPNPGNFGGVPQTQYPNQGNFGGAPQIQNQYPNQGNFGGSFPQEFGRPIGRFPNQSDFGATQNGQFPNQGGFVGSFPNQYPSMGNPGGFQPGMPPQYPNQGNIMGSQPMINSQYPNQGNVMGSQPNLNTQYPNQGSFGRLPSNQYPQLTNQINNGSPMLNAGPITQGGPINQNMNNFGPGTWQVGDGTLDGLMPPENSWNNNTPNNFLPNQFNGSDLAAPQIPTPSPAFPAESTTSGRRTNAILGNPVVVPSTTTERGKINYPTSTESAAVRQCVQDCATTSEYNPVCGSDNVTYINPGKFVCARNCGHEVFVANRGRCLDDTPFPRNALLRPTVRN